MAAKKSPPPLPPMVPIRALREAHGLTSRGLAERIAEHGVTVSPDSLIAVELGQTGVSRELLTAWAKALNILPVDVRRPADLRHLLVDQPLEEAS
jgi:transcriptional regulator with XRE-family HTH domain